MNKDGVLTLFLIADNFSFSPHINAPPTGAISLNDTRSAIDDGAGGKIGSRYMLH